MKKFSFNQEVLVQITDYGFDQIIAKYGTEFCEIQIYSKHEFHFGNSWYRLTVNFIFRYFRLLPLDFYDLGLIDSVLVPEDKIQKSNVDALNEHPFNKISIPPFFVDPNDDVFNSPIPDYLK